MKSIVFPFLPVPWGVAVRLSKPFNFYARVFVKTNKGFKKKLLQADINIDPITYISVSVFSSLFLAFSVFISISAIAFLFKPTVGIFLSAFLFGLLIGAANFSYSILFPEFLIKMKIRLIEKDLIFALRYMLLRIKSGIPLYDAMVSIAEGGYGEVSREFKKTIKEISSGKEIVKALEDMALRSPSVFFRRTIWQIANNMRAGTDIADILETITSTLSREHAILIRKYGSELNPLLLMYMMFTIVIPSLSVAVIVIMSSLAGMAVPIYVFYIIPIIVFVLQIMFISIMKSRRPMISI
ncbi:MAG: type II secretion system F family protein [Candidatus Aenigmarchaeota archaeon]|nr:type II secretion system F family protein [Candidatus Aenigmarchaeota archaeon]